MPGNPHSNTYYVLRGIKVCTRWRKFENFLADMDEKPIGFQLDRINNNLGYTPRNCRWIDKKSQMRNTRLALWVTFCGEKVRFLDLCDQYGIKQRTAKSQLRRGWRLQEIFVQKIVAK